MRQAVLAAGMAALFAGAMPAAAQTAGAPMAMPTQPGAWGPQGWQAGGVPAPAVDVTAPPAPGFSAPVPPAAPAYAAAAPIVAPHGYDAVLPGRKVKGPALANIVADPAPWGLPMPGPGMRWIRYYDTAVLLDGKNRSVQMRRVAWDAPRPRPMQAYAAMPAPALVRAPGVYRERHGNTVVTTRVLPPPAMVGGAYGGYGQVVSVTPGTVTTTTRTYWVGGKRPSHRRPVHTR